MVTGPTPLGIETVFREVYGHAVASLVRFLGDITVAEDAVQDAFVIATDRWAVEGIPANPHGWIATTARRRAIDGFRRRTRGDELEMQAAAPPVDDAATGFTDDGPVADDPLRLIFTCCHPALQTEAQIALTLRLLGGLAVDEIARSFLVSEAAMAKRLTRAKYKIAAANIAYRIPTAAELPERLDPVLSVIYLIYNAGADDLEAQAPLRTEAIRLARAVAELLPGEPEALGLLSLLLLNEARVPARRRDGEVVLLRDQDRRRWRRSAIEEGHRIVRTCIELDRPGPYQLQAAIQAVHCDAPDFGSTDWPQILVLYDHLWSLAPTPVVAMNRAIARMETQGPGPALDELAQLAPAFDDYAPFHAATAAALRRAGRTNEAIEAYHRAARLTPSASERRHLLEQVSNLQASG